MNVFARKRLPSKRSKNRRFFHNFLKNVERSGGFCRFSGNMPSRSQDFSPKAHILWEIGPHSIAGEITCTSGSLPPPARRSGCYIHSPRGFPIRLARWGPCFISPAAGGVNPPGGRVRLRRTPGRRTAPMPLRGSQGPRRGNYLYFRLSITASSSHRLLYSFSAWPLTQW